MLASPVLIHKEEHFMKTIHLLLASSDKRSANLIQAAVLDACYDRAAVETIRTSRLDELVTLGCFDRIDLIVLAPGKLQPAPKAQDPVVTAQEVAQAIYTLKRFSARPVLAVDVRAQDELLFREAGADGIFGFPFEGDSLKARVHKVLQLGGNGLEKEEAKPSLAALFLRGFQRLKSA